MSAEQTPDIERVLAAWFAENVTAETFTHATDEDFARGLLASGALAPVLAAAVREAEQRAWDEGANAVVEPYNTGTRVTLRAVIPFPENPYRADRITEPVSHEAATSGEEASKA